MFKFFKECQHETIQGGCWLNLVSLAAGNLPDIVKRMKLNLFAGGPIVGGHNVFGDFILPTAFPQWGWETNRVEFMFIRQKVHMWMIPM